MIRDRCDIRYILCTVITTLIYSELRMAWPPWEWQRFSAARKIHSISQMQHSDCHLRDAMPAIMLLRHWGQDATVQRPRKVCSTCAPDVLQPGCKQHLQRELPS